MNTRNLDRIAAAAAANGWKDRQDNQSWERPTANGTQTVFVYYGSRGDVLGATGVGMNGYLSRRDAGKLARVIEWLERPAAQGPAFDFEAREAAAAGIAAREAREDGRERAAARKAAQAAPIAAGAVHSTGADDREAIQYAHLGAGHSVASASSEAVALCVSLDNYADAAAAVRLNTSRSADAPALFAARLEHEQAMRDVQAQFAVSDAIEARVIPTGLDALAADLQSAAGFAMSQAHIYHLQLTGSLGLTAAHPHTVGELQCLHSLECTRSQRYSEAASDARSVAHSQRMQLAGAPIARCGDAFAGLGCSLDSGHSGSHWARWK